ncbi:MAG: hypothetical protein QOD06_1089 [Candidatus Binatota bacterium]|nr:hypothetical protein [Candidatus Binatota bacterium]
MAVDETLLIALPLLLLAAAALLVAAAPPQWALLGMVLAANVDVVSPAMGTLASDRVGLTNTLKHLSLPLMFAWRMGLRPGPVVRLTSIGVLWGGFVAYTALSVTRSPYPTAGLKFVTYLVLLGLLVTAAARAHANGTISASVACRGLVLCGCLGLIQSYGLGNPYGGAEERFTAFLQPQPFAQLVVVLTAIVVATGTLPLRASAVALAVALIVANGSRIAALGLLSVVAVRWLWAVARDGSAVRYVMLGAGTAALIIVTSTVDLLVPAESEMRAAALLKVGRSEGLRDIGTASFRLDMYAAVVDEIRARSMIDELVGSGTASGGTLVTDGQFYGYGEDRFDPNRTIHNEYLRVAYELGVIGAAVGVALLLGLAAELWRGLREDRGAAALCALVAAPAVLSFLATENVLASGLAGSGLALSLVVGGILAGIQEESTLFAETPGFAPAGARWC